MNEQRRDTPYLTDEEGRAALIEGMQRSLAFVALRSLGVLDAASRWLRGGRRRAAPGNCS